MFVNWADAGPQTARASAPASTPRLNHRMKTLRVLLLVVEQRQPVTSARRLPPSISFTRSPSRTAGLLPYVKVRTLPESILIATDQYAFLLRLFSISWPA